MTARRLSFFGLIALLTLPAAAQGPSGTWNANVETGNGPVPMVFKLKADGDQLTGTISSDFLPELPIEEGVVNGNELSFKLQLQSMKLVYKGVLNGDQLTLSTTVEGRPPGGPEEQTFVATREQ